MRNQNKENKRPLLGENITLDQIIDLSEKRNIHYSIADVTITTYNKTTKDINNEIIELLRSNYIEH